MTTFVFIALPDGGQRLASAPSGDSLQTFSSWCVRKFGKDCRISVNPNTGGMSCYQWKGDSGPWTVLAAGSPLWETNINKE